MKLKILARLTSLRLTTIWFPPIWKNGKDVTDDQDDATWIVFIG